MSSKTGKLVAIELLKAVPNSLLLSCVTYQNGFCAIAASKYILSQCINLHALTFAKHVIVEWFGVTIGKW